MKLDVESVLEFHRGGKVALHMPHPVKTVEDLCLAYTPGVGKAVLHLDQHPEDAFEYTDIDSMLRNWIAGVNCALNDFPKKEGPWQACKYVNAAWGTIHLTS